MLTHYFRILLRKQPVFTAVNFLGLALGITAALCLFKYVQYEQNYDRQSPHAAQIWRVFNETTNAEKVVTQDANTHSAVGPTLKNEVAEVLDFARLYCGNSAEVVAIANQQAFDLQRFYCTDPGFLRMFPQVFLAGDPATCLNAPRQALLTQSTAIRLFGQSDPMGQNFKISEGMLAGDYTVSAVVADPPTNTHLKFDALASYATRYAQGFQDNFDGYWDYNYIQLAAGAGTEQLRQKLQEINETHLKNEGIRLDIQRFTDIHLHSNLTYELEPNGSARAVRFMWLIALLILGIAFVNYVNLTTALATERAKEVGIRKAVGASRAALTRQFLMESCLLTLAAFAVAVLMMRMGLQAFGDLVGRSLVFDFSPAFWGPVASLVAVVSLLAGAYPAFQLSGFQPVEVLRGRFGGLKAEGLRKSLVVAQFVCSVGLIFGVLVVSRQLDFLKKHELGVQLAQTVSVKTPTAQGASDTLSAQKLAYFKAECGRLPGVSGLASSNVLPGLGLNGLSGSNRPLHWTQSPDYAHVTSYFVNADQDFFKLFGIKILAGEHRVHEDARARYGSVSINRAMLDALGFLSPEAAIGQQIAYENSENGASLRIQGVIENFHIESLKTAPKPTLYYGFPPEQMHYLSLKIAPDNTAETLEAMQRIWRAIYPDQPFRYWFLDENFARQYQSETQFGRVFGLFAALAICISCLGLLGLTAFNVRRRTKEIGIRKVLGASVSGISNLLIQDFAKLILLAILLAAFPSYWLMQKWLSEFAYRIDIQWWMFVLTGLLAFAVAGMAVGIQSVKAALMNPVKSLRNE